jgi:CBS domain containing-hemolysin-like protein
MTATLYISSAIAIATSFMCSMAEALLLSLNPLTISRLQAKRPVSAESWRRLKRNISRPITAILILNTIANTGGATVAGGAFMRLYGNDNLWIFSVLFTLIILFGTEIMPKIIGVTFRDRLAPYGGPILEMLTTILRPFILLSEFLFKRLTSDRESDQITTADLVTLASLARSGKAIGLEQENIIVNAVRLSHTLINCVMITPEHIRFIKRGDSAETILALARASGHSRYPVSRSTEVKDIFAFIQIKRAIPAYKDEIEHLVENPRPISTVNQRETLITALRSMLENREHLLSVVDDHHCCVGIVTLEDIAGELLGADIDLFR